MHKALNSLNRVFRVTLAAALLVGTSGGYSPAQELETQPVPLPVLSPQEFLQKIGGPTLISLHFKDAHPKDVFAELSRQSGISIQPQFEDLWDKQWDTISIDVDQQPFWQVARELGEKAKIQLDDDSSLRYPYGSTPVLKLNRLMGSGSPFMSGIEQTQGPFKLIARTIGRDYSAAIMLGTDLPVQPRQNLSVLSYLYLDPKLANPKSGFLANSGQYRFDEVTDDKGNSLLHELRARAEIISDAPGAIARLSGHFKAPALEARRLAILKGEYSFLWAATSMEWEVANIATAGKVTKTVQTPQGNLVYSVSMQKRATNDYEVRVLIENAKDIQLSYAVLSALDPRAGRLLDAEGRHLYINGGGGNSVDWKTRFIQAGRQGQPDVGEPVKFVMTIPVDVRRVVVPFEFKDLPLP